MPTIVRSIPQAQDRTHVPPPVLHQPASAPDSVPVPQEATPGTSDGPAPRGGARRAARRSSRGPESTDTDGDWLALTTAPKEHRAATVALIALLVLAVLSMIGVLLATIFVLPDYLEENGFIDRVQQSQTISLSVLTGR